MRKILPLLVLAWSSMLMPEPAAPQSMSLSPQQQQLLNELTPDQRRDALAALQQGQSGPSGSAQKPVREIDDVGDRVGVSTVRAQPDRGELRAGVNSPLLLDMTFKEALTADEVAQFSRDPVLRRLRGSNVYELDGSGILSLLGIRSIPLLGLTESDIERRLEAESILSPFDITVRILETESTGVDALRPFGYEILEPRYSSFEPPTTGPVPGDYVLGPGDSVRVQYFGNVNGVYEFDVTRDGVLNLPEIGPVTVAGMRFTDFREDIDRRVKEMLIGTQVSVSIGQLRTIRVFVLGDANMPGSYVVSSLATISSALYRSGGVSRVGSLRNVQLKRNGKTVSRLDLYDLFLRGDTSGDMRLQSGDVIFIPPVSALVSISGAVNRPAIYEFTGSATVRDAVRLAGGFTADAFPDGAKIERIDSNEKRIVVSIDADNEAASRTLVRSGDILTIPRVLPDLENSITVAGHVYRPGPYEWRSGMRLTDLIGSELDLKPGADTSYLLIRREHPETRRVSVISANLSAALDGDAGANETLQPRDTVHVFSLAFGRQHVIGPILDELELQAQTESPFSVVTITGRVKAPGVYPMERGMRISDLLRAGGNLAEQAYTLTAELTRYEVIAGKDRATQVIPVDLQSILNGSESADLLLAEHDDLRISSVPNWDSLWSVELEGEVKFPGTYRIRRGETLRQVLTRAGGISDDAFPEGAVFLRESLREREQEQIETLARRLEADLTAKSFQDTDVSSVQSLEIGRSMLSQLRATKAVGRLVIDLAGLIAAPDGDAVAGDIELRDGDRLLVPKLSQEVTVIGETQQNTSHLYRSNLSRDDYIDMSGGLTRKADKKLIYVVRASGEVVTSNRSRWLGRGSAIKMRPGDTIVVPLETDRMRPMTLWANVTQILYQVAIAAAAVNSFK